MNETEIFISYAWGEGREDIVDSIEETFKEKGYKFIRDKVDLSYKGRITEFMNRIGNGKIITVVISDKYLRSENCMYEIVQIYKKGQFQERIFPIVLSDANFYKPVNRIKYVKHWENEIKLLNEAMKSIENMANISDIQIELKNYDDILKSISSITSIVKDMNTLTPEMHKDNDFCILIRKIEEQLKKDNQTLNLDKIDAIQVQEHKPDLFDYPLVYVEGGTFFMGNDNETSREKPAHFVTVNSFQIGRYLVTQRLWVKVMGSNPSYFNSNDSLPVEQVSMTNIQSFIERLNEITGKTYRLPTEAEWEFAARGGNESKGFTYSGSNDINEVAWYKDNSEGTTHLVGTKDANELGIYDMSGNVGERCADWFKSYPNHNHPFDYTNSQHVIRGGAFGYNKKDCTVSLRFGNGSALSVKHYGFRLVLED